MSDIVNLSFLDVDFPCSHLILYIYIFQSLFVQREYVLMFMASTTETYF